MDNNAVNSGLAVFLTEQFRHYQLNRRDQELRWDLNLDAFIGRTSNMGNMGAANQEIFLWSNSFPGKVGEGEGWRSRRIINFTRQKVISATAIIGDMLFQGGKLPFMYKPSMWDDIVNASGGPDPSRMSEEKVTIEKFRKLTEQQLSDCNAVKEVTRNILAAALYGKSWGKMRVKDYTRHGWQQLPVSIPGITDYSRMPERMLQWQPYDFTITQPSYEFCSTWDVFYDMEVPKDVQGGAGVYHRKMVSPRYIMQRKGRPGYNNTAIDMAISSAAKPGVSTSLPMGTTLTSLPPYQRQVYYRQSTMQYLEFWGKIPTELYKAHCDDCQCQCSDDIRLRAESENDTIEVMCIMADNQIIYLQEMPEGKRPFFMLDWLDQDDEKGSIGVAEMVRNAQEMVNWAVRAYEDNKKQTANAVWVLKRRLLVNDLKSIVPGQKIDVQDDCDDVRKAVMQLATQDVGEQLMNLIQLAEKYADKDSLIPALQQGQDVKEPQMRAFVAARQLEQAGKYIGQIISNIDTGLIEPLVEALYDWNMADPSVNIGKGNYTVKALGFTSFQDRVERITKLQQQLQLVLGDPDLKAQSNLRWYLEEIAKALDLDPDQCLKSPQQLEQDQQQQQQMAALQGAANKTPPDPALQAKVQSMQADAAKKMAEADAIAQKTVIDKAKAVHAIRSEQNEQARAAQQSLSPAQEAMRQ